jgi:hypothetical protein
VGALAAIAFGLFVIRYLLTSSLSIQQALVPLQLGETIERIEDQLGLPGQRNRQSETGRPEGESPAQTTQPNKQPGALAGKRNPESDATEQAEMSAAAHGTMTQNAENRSQSPAGQVRGQSGISSVAQSRPDNRSGKAASKSAAPQQAASNHDEPGSTDQNSQGLVDKMKDALSSLVAKLHPNVNSQTSSREDQASQDPRKGDQASAARDQKGNLQQSTPNDQAARDQDAQGAMRGQTAEKTQTSQNQSSDESSSDRKGANMHSGIGHTNGDKDIKDAEQLKAMGKLAEIIGRRSANLTGDITVETSSTNQQLRTQYSGRVGQHADLGGEINRDEIPVMYRAYVREYMQLVHKQAEKQQ